MMNNYVKSALIFVGGMLTGSGIAWFVTKKHYEKVMDDEISSQVAETKEWYVDLINKTEAELRKEWEADVDEIVDKVVNDLDVETDGFDWDYDENGRPLSYTDRMNKRKEQLLKPERVRYETFSKPAEEEVDEVRLERNNDNPRDDIYIISAEQFAKERHGFDKVTLYWWELERILTEEDLDILDVPGLIGTDWEQHIGEEEKDVVYVRNENLETDYEVVTRHESFYEVRD